MTLSFAVLSFLLTYLIHSTLLLGGAWLLLRLRALRTPAAEDALWKLALVGGVVTAALQIGLDVRPLGGHLRFGEEPAPVQRRLAPVAQDVGLLVRHDAAPTARRDAAALLPAHLDALTSTRDGARPARRTVTRRSTRHAPAAASGASTHGSQGAHGTPVLAAPVTADLTTPAARAADTQSVRLPSLADAEWQDVLVMLWAAVSALGLLAFGRAHLRLRRALGRRQRVQDPALLRLLDRLTEGHGMHGRVRLSVSPLLAGPVALGREIVLPRRALTELGARQQEAMLAHELGHVARRDPLWLQLGAVLGALFFFQPLNHVARRRLGEAAEFLSDDWAVGRTGRGLVLAQCLAQVATWVDQGRAPALAAGMVRKDRSFVRRVERLAASGTTRRHLRPLHALTLGLVVLGSVSCGVPGVSWGDDDEPSLLESVMRALRHAVAASQDTADDADLTEVDGEHERVRPAVGNAPVPRRLEPPKADALPQDADTDEDVDLEFSDGTDVFFTEDIEFSDEADVFFTDDLDFGDDGDVFFTDDVEFSDSADPFAVSGFDFDRVGPDSSDEFTEDDARLWRQLVDDGVIIVGDAELSDEVRQQALQFWRPFARGEEYHGGGQRLFMEIVQGREITDDDADARTILIDLGGDSAEARPVVIGMGDDGRAALRFGDEGSMSFDDFRARLTELEDQGESVSDAEVLWRRADDGSIVIHLRREGGQQSRDDVVRAARRAAVDRERVERDAARARRDVLLVEREAVARARAEARAVARAQERLGAQQAEEARERAAEARRAARELEDEFEDRERSYERARRDLERALERLEREHAREMDRAVREYERALRDHEASFEFREREIEDEYERHTEELERQEEESADAFDDDEDAYEEWLVDWQHAVDDAMFAYDDAMELLSRDAEDAYDDLEDEFEDITDEYEDVFDDRWDDLEEQLEDLEDEYEEFHAEWEERFEEYADLRDCDHDCVNECSFGCTHPDQLVFADWDPEEWAELQVEWGDELGAEWAELHAEWGDEFGDEWAELLAEEPWIAFDDGLLDADWHTFEAEWLEALEECEAVIECETDVEPEDCEDACSEPDASPETEPESDLTDEDLVVFAGAR